MCGTCNIFPGAICTEHAQKLRSDLYVTLHRKISHNAGEEFLELARAGQSTFNQLSFGTKISFIPGSVPELRHFEVTEVKKSTMEKRSKTLIIAWVGVN